MIKRKYRYGDSVIFQHGEDVLVGKVYVVDVFVGITERNREPSYGIFRRENGTLYNHIRESSIKGKEE